MNPGYTLSDAIRINADIPELHTLSIETARESMRQGDFIEVGIERKPTAGAPSPTMVESVLARVEAIHWPFIDATVQSKVRFTKYHGMRTGNTLSCESKQILCWLARSHPKTAGFVTFYDKIWEADPKFLPELLVDDFPENCFTRCVLDETATVLIRPMGGGTLCAIVGVDAAESDASSGSRTQPKEYATAFDEAATRLGVPVGRHSSSGRNQFVVSVERPATGQNLIDLVLTTREKIHQEARRFLAGQSARPDESTQHAG